MAVQAVPRLRDALGNEGVGELITLVDERVREQAVLRGEYQQVIAHLQRIDDRFIEMDRHFEVRLEQMNRHFEARVEEMSRRFEDHFDKMEQRAESRIDRRFGEMDQRLDKMDQRLDRMDQRFDKMYDRMLVQSWWLIVFIALLGTVIGLLLSVGLFVK